MAPEERNLSRQIGVSGSAVQIVLLWLVLF